MATSSVTSKRNTKLEKMLENMFKGESFVKVGIIGKPETVGISAESKKTGDSSAGKALTLYDIGMIHEFGLESRNIPQRSFIRQTYDKNRKRLQYVTDKLVKADAKRGKFDEKRILFKVGTWFVGEIKDEFTSASNGWDDLKRPRHGKKGSFIGPRMRDTPLVDTGQLRASIGFEIVGGSES